MDLAFTVVSHLVNAEYDSIPPEAIEVSKKMLLDQFAVALAGSTADGSKEAVELMVELGGKRESTVWVYGTKIPAINAAFANAAMGHGWDYDDTHPESFCHVGSVAIPVAFAMAERRGRASGKELLLAMNLGVDLACRLGRACRVSLFESGWHNTQLFGTFGAAAIAGRLLGFTETQMHNALGIAYSLAAGNTQCIQDGTHTKRLHPAFAAKSGVLAALLAEKGVEGAINIFEADFGLFNVYHRGEYDPTLIVSGLGRQYETAEVGFKNHPGCAKTQAYADATMSLIREHNIKPEEVETITAYGGPKTANVPGKPSKKEIRNVTDAQFSVYWTIANALIRQRATLEEYTEEAVLDPRILALARRIEFRIKPDFVIPGTQNEKSMVEIKTTRHDDVYRCQVDIARGQPGNLMSYEEHLAKMKECVALAARPVPFDYLESLSDAVQVLETMDDVRALIPFLIGVDRSGGGCMG